MLLDSFSEDDFRQAIAIDVGGVEGVYSEIVSLLDVCDACVGKDELGNT